MEGQCSVHRPCIADAHSIGYSKWLPGVEYSNCLSFQILFLTFIHTGAYQIMLYFPFPHISGDGLVIRISWVKFTRTWLSNRYNIHSCDGFMFTLLCPGLMIDYRNRQHYESYVFILIRRIQISKPQTSQS